MTICGKNYSRQKRAMRQQGEWVGGACDTCLPLQRIKLDNISDAESSSVRNSLRTLIWQGYSEGLNEIITAFVCMQRIRGTQSTWLNRGDAFDLGFSKFLNQQIAPEHPSGGGSLLSRPCHYLM